MLKSLSTTLIWRGILALGVGIAALAWPGATVYALVIMFAVLAFMSAGQEAVRAFSSTRGGPVLGHLALGLIDVAAGITALVWPAPTALVLVLIVGSWAIAGGVAELYAAFRREEVAGARAMYVLGGLASIAFGVILFARPTIGAVTLAVLFGMFNVLYGIAQLTIGIDMRHARTTVRPVSREAVPA
jgi:uncharacterized membrane protein HdeD (DUF308 family)